MGIGYRHPFVVLGPIGWANHAFGEDLGDDGPFRLVVECILVVPLCTPRRLQLEVRGDSHSEKAIGPFHKEGFCAAGKVKVQHPSLSEASRDVGDNVLRDLDAKSRAIGGGMDLG